VNAQNQNMLDYLCFHVLMCPLPFISLDNWDSTVLGFGIFCNINYIVLNNYVYAVLFFL
jgi:hypothetical protein